MKIKLSQLRKIIRESLILEGSWDEADDVEKANAMLGFLHSYTVDDSVAVDQRLSRTLKMKDAFASLFAARDAGKEPSASGDAAAHLEKVKNALTQGNAAEDWDHYVSTGEGVTTI